MNRASVCSITLLIAVRLIAALLCPDVIFAQTCDQWIGKAVSVQGSVQALKKGETQWRSVHVNDTYCPGDMIRVLKRSRADIVLRNEATLRLDQNTTITFSQPEEERTLLINLVRGAAYFFSRISRGLKILTPFVNATVEGTEFFVNVESGRTLVTVFDGTVSTLNEAGHLTIGKGQSAVAEAGRAPIAQILVRPRDAIQWTLYYPPTLYVRAAEFESGTPGGWQALVLKSIDLYREGYLQQAIDVLENVTEDIRDPGFYTYRASLLLSVGRAEEAMSDIEGALRLSPANSQALALQSVIAVAQNDKDTALALARKAVETGPLSVSARIALSYALQAHFDLNGALDSLKDGVKLEPDNALAWARLAELWLSFSELGEALKAANRAVTLDPGLSRTQTVLGFAFLCADQDKTIQRCL